MVSYFFYKTMLMNTTMPSLGEGCGDFHFLVHLCMLLLLLLLLKEKACVTFIIRIKNFLWGGQTKTPMPVLLAFIKDNDKIHFLQSARTCTTIHIHKFTHTDTHINIYIIK